MRWLFVGIVILNAVYFSWAFWVADDSSKVVSPRLETTTDGRGGGLRLLSEGTEQLSSPPALALAETRVAGCPALAADDEEEAKLIAGTLSGHGYPASVQSSEGELVSRYWVYLPPFPSRSQANRALRELQAKSVDSFVVASGPDMNAVSLGTFASKDSAKGMQSRLVSAGYQAQVREAEKASRDYWVVLAKADAQGYTEFVPEPVRAAVRQSRRPCLAAR